MRISLFTRTRTLYLVYSALVRFLKKTLTCLRMANTQNVATAYATQPGYYPVAQDDFHAVPPPPAYYAPAGQNYTQQPAASAPPYYPAQPRSQHPGYAQQQSTNNVVVVQQTAAVIPVCTRPAGYVHDAGQGALVFAMIITIFAFIFGCWWSVFCSIPAIVFASSANTAGLNGDRESARSNNNMSYVCTIAAIVSAVVGLGIIFGVVFGIGFSRSSSSCYYDSYYCY